MLQGSDPRRVGRGQLPREDHRWLPQPSQERRQIEIEGRNSRNKTFVHGNAARTAPLRHGDEIRLADVDLVYEG